jgi:hypothetical protein
MDKYRLVMPPTLFAVLAAPFWKFAHAIIFWNWYAALAAYCGGIFGYTCYDMTHYFLHHQKYAYASITCNDMANKTKGYLLTTNNSRSTTSLTTLQTTKTGLVLLAASGTASSVLSLRWALPRSSSPRRVATHE